MSGTVDLAVVFDEEALANVARRIGAGSVVVVDSSLGSPPADAVPEGVEVVQVPFGRLSVRRLRRGRRLHRSLLGTTGRRLGIRRGIRFGRRLDSLIAKCPRRGARCAIDAARQR